MSCKKSKCFTDIEIDILIDLVEVSKNIVENGKMTSGKMTVTTVCFQNLKRRRKSSSVKHSIGLSASRMYRRTTDVVVGLRRFLMASTYSITSNCSDKSVMLDGDEYGQNNLIKYLI